MLLKKFEKFHKLFILVGLAPINTTNERKTIGKKIFETIFYSAPPIYSMVATLIIFQFSFFPHVDFGMTLVVVFSGYYLIVTISNIVVNIQCLVYRREYFRIIQRINDINDMFASHCDREVNYQQFARSYRKKFLVLCILWIGMAIGSLVPYIGDLQLILFSTGSIALESLFSMSCMHAILFVDHVGVFIKEMNKCFHSPMFQPSDSAELMGKNFVKLKRLHFEIWNLVQQINKFFGWSFVALSVKYLFDITFTFYSMYVNFVRFGWNTMEHFEEFMYLLYSLTSLMLLTNSCQYCISETENLVPNIVQYATVSWDDNRCLYNHMHDTLTQIRQLPLRIAALALFNVDRKQLASIITGICTCLVISIQFQISELALQTPESNQ